VEHPPARSAPHGGVAASVVVMHEQLDALPSHPPATHTEHVLSYIEAGHISFHCGAEVHAGAGSLVVVPAGVPHQSLHGAHLDVWMVSFCATCVQLAETAPLMSEFRRVRRGAAPVLTVPPARRDHVRSLFAALEQEAGRSAPESPELVRSLLLLLLGETRRASPGGDVETADDLATAALEFIRAHAFEPISLRDVAAAVHRTPSHVASVVKGATGHTVGSWIRSARVAEAATRLAHTDDPLPAIAEHVGWQDTTHFIRQFRKVYGVTPAAWRRAQRTRDG